MSYKIIHFSESDVGGGSSFYAYRLHKYLNKIQKVDSKMFVLKKNLNDNSIKKFSQEHDLRFLKYLYFFFLKDNNRYSFYNYGKYLIKETGRDMKLWNGSCIVHEAFSLEKIIDLIKKYPQAKFIAHPESESPVLEIANFIGSTSELLNFIQRDLSDTYIVATENGILHEMKKKRPNKKFIPAPIDDDTCACSECSFMKMNTLEKLYLCLLNETPEIILPNKIIDKSIIPIEKMLALG